MAINIIQCHAPTHHINESLHIGTQCPSQIA
jgi:hypothetical protein